MRETKILEIGGHKIEIKTYVTGGEAREIQGVLLKNVKVGDGGDIGKINATVMTESQDKAIEMIVESFDESKDDILKKVLDLPKNDFDELVLEINKSQEGLSKKKPKN